MLSSIPVSKSYLAFSEDRTQGGSDNKVPWSSKATSIAPPTRT